MYTEWGIRTLSGRCGALQPDELPQRLGLAARHGADRARASRATAARRRRASCSATSTASSLYYEGARLPELFCGFAGGTATGPTRYPVACSPQAWAAGAPFLLLSAMLGFEPEAERERLTLRAPALPQWMDSLELRRLKLGAQNLNLKFDRSNGGTSVVLGGDSEIEVHVVPR